MKKLAVKVPVNSLKGAKMQISAGADEIYVGFDFDYLNEFTFSGRCKKSDFNGKSTVPSYEEFLKIVELAQKNKVIVEFVANVPILNDLNVSGKNECRKKFLEYIKLGVEAGVDRIIVGDLGNLMYIKDAGITTPITLSTFFSTINAYQVKFFEKLGISKIVLPHPLKFSEIKEIKDSTNLEVEIFGHFGCSFLEGTCNLLHRRNESVNVGIPCKACYKVEGSENNILDVREDCSLCQLKEIMDTGVDSIKIIGRDLDPDFMSNITAIYKSAIELYNEGCTKAEVIEAIKEDFDFDYWEKFFCKEQRCKYVNDKYYV